MSDHRDGKVITFYSYKGGTGRTMALANVAWILAANGKRVLVVDWDLESPGLARYFSPFLDRAALDSTEGVIEMIREYEWATTRHRGDDERWYEEYARVQKYSFSLRWPGFPDEGTLDFLSAGQQNNDYSSNLAAMDWDAFYERQRGGLFLDALRADMKRHYDYTLIDSRTGFSDVADICTIHLPDTLVTCFTLNDQGIDGAADVARLVDRRHRKIRVLPVPMRVDPSEQEKADIGRRVAIQRFAGLPVGLDPDQRGEYWKKVEIPYRAFYAYEEVLAVFGDEPGVRTSLLAAYEALTAQITSGDVTSLPPMDEVTRQRTRARFIRQAVVAEREVLLRYARQDRVWAEWVTHVLQQAGVQVIDPWDGDPKDTTVDGFTRTLVLVSQANVEREATHVVPDRAADRAPFAVYVADVRRLAGIPQANTATVFGATAEVAVDRILRLIGADVEHVEAEVAGGPRFPGRDNLVFSMPSRNIRFTGREQDLRQLRDQLRAGTAVVLAGNEPVALQGMGGIGKTQLAIEYAYRFRAAYDVIFWMNVEQSNVIETELADLGTLLGVPARQSTPEYARAVLQSLQHTDKRWLIVFDNAEDAPGIEQYLPTGTGHVIITSRMSTWGERVKLLPVNVFTRDESKQHLRQRVPTMQDVDAGRIAELLGDLPIAVAAAAAWLADTGNAVDEYLVHIARSGPRGLREPQSDTPIEATWDLSLRRLNQRSPAAYRLLQMCSVFAPEIALDLVYSDEFAAALRPLDPNVSDYMFRASLVQQVHRLALLRLDLRGEPGSRERTGTVFVHRLLQHAVRIRMSEDELTQTRRQVHRVLAAARPKNQEVDDPDAWPQYRMLWPHVEVTKAALSDDESVRALMIDRVRYQWLRGDLVGARQSAEQFDAIWSQMLEETEDPDQRRTLHRQLLHLRFNHANILGSQGNFTDSLRLDEAVLATQQELLGARHPHTLMTAGGLARDLRGLGRYREALDTDISTYAAWLDDFGEDYPRTLAALSNLAISYRLMGDFHEARARDEAAYNSRKSILGESNPYTLYSATNLGRDIRDAGDYDQSVDWLASVYEQYKVTRAEDSRGMLVCQTNLAVSLHSAGRAAEAAELLQSASSQLSVTFGRTNPDALSSRLSLAVTLLSLGKFAESRELLTDVYESYRDNLGDEHPHTLVCIGNLALLARAQGDHELAVRLAEEAVEGLHRKLGDEHPYTLSTRMNWAVCVAETPGGLDNAMETLERVAEQMQVVLLPDHPNALRCQANLSLVRQLAEVGGGDFVDRVAALEERVGQQHPTVNALRRRELVHRIIDPHPY
ncbi:hypothetical protein GCM10009827_099750 [Dactylosporangium maewongense]|uniref:ATP/GTP-binding protein n=1 Tax=Dactylosporangium maewongense TaxID=634393 RepID=A0ABP4NJ42_9ACTN